jgi:hypothetical protein
MPKQTNLILVSKEISNRFKCKKVAGIEEKPSPRSLLGKARTEPDIHCLHRMLHDPSLLIYDK